MIMRNGIVAKTIVIDPIIKAGIDIITEEVIIMNSKQNKNVEYVNRITKYGDVIVINLDKK